MKTENIHKELEAALASGDFIEQSAELADKWSNDPDRSQAIGPVLSFMEQHPEAEFGNPGPLVHFLEGFYGFGYEHELLISVARKPTKHTIWMLNRLINGTKDADTRSRFVEALRQAASHPFADAGTRERAVDLLRLHT